MNLAFRKKTIGKVQSGDAGYVHMLDKFIITIKHDEALSFWFIKYNLNGSGCQYGKIVYRYSIP